MKISVVIPAYNEAELLPRALAALMPQAFRYGAEVIVVDNNSSDATADIARQAGARVVHEPHQGYVFAMNLGLRLATGDIVAFTDADSLVAPDWLKTIATSFADQHIVGLTGPIHFDRLRMIGWSRIFFPTGLVGSNMAIRRRAALAAGGFDTKYNLASDVAFGWQLKRHGRLKYLRHLKVSTSARRFQDAPVREGFRYGLNYAWMVLFRRPLFWHFAPIRRAQAELDRLANRRLWWTTSGISLVVLLYLSLWPTSSVFGQITVKGHTKAKVVALTFDDGPNGQATRSIVDILVSKHTPATFFEVGRSVAADTATAKYVADHGFTIGNHSWDHSFNLPYDSPSMISRELSKTQAVIHQATGQQPGFFRPPHGFRSPQLLYEARHQNFRLVDWSVDPRDYLAGNSQVIILRVLHHVQSGSIVLMHDGLQDGPKVRRLKNRTGTIAALPVIIDRLRQRGYTFVSLDQLLRREPEQR